MLTAWAAQLAAPTSVRATDGTALNPLNGPPSPFILHEVELNWSQLGVCEDWCADEVKLNRTKLQASEGRTVFPADDVATWAEKCSWGGSCSGCDACATAPQCSPSCAIINNPAETADYKDQTQGCEQTCAWKACEGCAVCAEPKCVRGAAAAAGQGQEAPPPQMEEGADEPEQLQTAQPPAKIKKQQGGSGSDIGVALAVQLPSTVDTPSCPEMGQRASFDAFLTDERGDPTVPTPFGRSLSGGGCACRFCDDVTTGLHQPAHLVNDTEASLCFSTYDDENMMATGLIPTGTGCTDDGYGSLGKDELLEQMAMANTTDNVAALVPTFEGCLAPDRSADGLPKQVLFLVGNSHTGALSAAVKLAVRGVYQVRSLTISNTYLRNFPDKYPAGYAAITEALKGLLQPGDILCPVWWNNPLKAVSDGTKDAGPLTELLESVVVPSGANMLVLGPYPARAQASSEAWEETTGFAYGEAMAALAEKYPQLHYVDLFRPFCDIDDESNACSCVTTPGQVVSAYFNEHHINVAGSIYLWPYICDAMEDGGLLTDSR